MELDMKKEVEKEEAGMVEKQSKYLYVYGIINKGDFKGKGKLNNQMIMEIDFKDISALVSLYPNLHPILKEEEAMQHADILKKIAKKTAIIPMSYGMVFKNKQILNSVLSKSYRVVKETLRLIDGKIELGVKAIKGEFDDVSDDVVRGILKSLEKNSIKSKKGDKFSERILLNYSFLVEKDKFSKFSEQVGKLERKFKDFKFIYTGPWPVYSFVDIKIAGG